MPTNTPEYDRLWRIRRQALRMLCDEGYEVEEFRRETVGLDFLAHNGKQVRMIRVVSLTDTEPLDREKIKSEMFCIEIPETVSVELWVYSKDTGFVIESLRK